jgi:uncharacterized protein GlcG (DUF336 family)
MITLEAARRMIRTAQQRARELNVRIVVAVADAAGHLVALERMDGAKWICVDLARAKASTAAAFGEPTLEFGRRTQPGTELYGINSLGLPGIAVFGGGVPVVDKAGSVVGAVGVSGSPTDTDCACAEAAALAFDE